AESLKPLGICFGLHYGDAQRRQYTTKEELDQRVTAIRLSGDAAINQCNWNLPRFALAQKVRPKLGLHDQHRSRVNRLQRSTHGPAPVKRKVENTFSLRAEDISRQVLTRQRGRRDDECVMRKLLFQPSRERPRGLCLTNRNTVKPDHRLPA